MKRKKLFTLLLFICIIGSGIKFIFFPDENAKIRKTINLAISELKKKDINNFIKHFTLDYKDGFGNTYGTLYLFLRNNISICKYIYIDINQIEIERNKSEAKVKFFAKAIVKTIDGEIYKEAGRFILRMRKEDFKWKIFRLDEMEYEFD
jgi:SAM-dependent methyltransferase